MSFQDNFFLGFELDHHFYALPIASVHHVFYQEVSEQLSHILKIDEMIVFEGEPYYLSKPNKVLPLPSLQDDNDDQDVTALKPTAPWVIVMKNEKLTATKKGLGFRVQQIMNPFELSDTNLSSGEVFHTHAGKQYQVIRL